MKSSIRQKLLWTGIILAFFLMEACNRGIGCPRSSNLPPGWLALTSSNQLEEVNTQSYDKPVIIFKHSSRCSISDIAFNRLIGKNSEFPLSEQITCYFLDIFRSPGLSQQVAKAFEVYHESPQILLITDGQCVYETSHLDISIVELEEQIGLTRQKSV